MAAITVRPTRAEVSIANAISAHASAARKDGCEGHAEAMMPWPVF
jgi:hypothetical protein